MRSSSNYKHSLFNTPLNQNQSFSILNSMHTTKNIKKTICAKLRTFTKHHYLQYSCSKIVENASWIFFLRSRLDETIGVRLIPAIDNRGLKFNSNSFDEIAFTIQSSLRTAEIPTRHSPSAPANQSQCNGNFHKDEAKQNISCMNFVAR